jgi:hypothetical protein
MPQDLCDFEDVQRVLGLALGSQMDTERLLELMDDDEAFSYITDASREFEGLIGRTVEQKQETITVSGDGTNILILDRKYTPVISLDSVHYAGANDSEVDVELEDADAGIIRLDRSTLQSVRNRLSLPRFTVGVNNIEITLTYGWATVPQDIRGAVARMAAAEVLMMDQDEQDGGVSSKRLGDRSVSYGREGRHANRLYALECRINRVARRYGAEVQA